MIQLNGVTLRRGIKCLWENASARIEQGEKVGLVGANGSGKSSLFALLKQELSPDAGSIDLASKWVIASVAQETPALNRSALDYVIDGDQALRTAEAEVRAAEQADDAYRLANAHEKLYHLDGYTAPARAAQLLSGLGFAAATLEQPVSAFSGGWRMRLNLARALMCPADILLLDEPTNHLDLDAILWLERWLTRFAGTLLLISHDREFLDNLTQKIIHIEDQTLNVYRGNYAAFERARAEARRLQQAHHIKQQAQRAHLQKFVDRFRAKASKAKQAQSRLKALEKMELIAAIQEDNPFNFEFPETGKLPNPLLRFEEVALGYGDEPILQQISFSLDAEARIGILGLNGAGKSTLVKALAGTLAPQSGTYQQSSKLRIGYFAQHQVDYLNLSWSPLAHLQALAPEVPEKQLRAFLGQFAFSKEMADGSIEIFSGGEKARLALALIVWQRPNLLLLDEPTNHLDLAMRDALNQALQSFQGTLVLVSHDRHLLRTSCDTFYLVSEGRVHPFAGDLEAYQIWAQQPPSEPTQPQTPAANSKKQQRRDSAAKRQQRQPIYQKLRRCEHTLEKISDRLKTIERALADETLYQPEQQASLLALHQEQAELKLQQQNNEELWLELQQQIEAG